MRSLTPKDLGGLIREARVSAGLTQTELGEKIGASRYWVAEFERGKAGAELGLTLKALRALKLVLTIEPKETVLRREQENQESSAEAVRILNQPAVDLSSILARLTIPIVRERQSDPFHVYDWSVTPHPTQGQTEEVHEPRSTRKRKSR